MKNNTLSSHDFIFWTIYGAIMISFLYRKLYAMTYVGIGKTLLQIVLTVVLLFFLAKRSRNYPSVIFIILFPLVILEAMAYWKTVPVVPVATGVGFWAALVLSVMVAKRKAGRFREKQWKKISFRRTFLRVFSMTFGLIMLVGVVYGRSVHVRQLSVLIRNVMADYEFDSTADGGNTLENNIETLSKLDPKGGWNSLNLEDVCAVLETVIRVECRYFGMGDVLPDLNIAYTEREELLGFYDRESDTITLSYDYLMSKRMNGYSVCQVLCHELFHRYQYSLIELLETLEASEATEKYANLLLLYDTSVYRSEMGHYISGKDDHFLYASQQLERDAESYGNEAVAVYYKAIQEYFAEQDQGGKEMKERKPAV